MKDVRGTGGGGNFDCTFQGARTEHRTVLYTDVKTPQRKALTLTMAQSKTELAFKMVVRNPLKSWETLFWKHILRVDSCKEVCLTETPGLAHQDQLLQTEMSQHQAHTPVAQKGSAHSSVHGISRG